MTTPATYPDYPFASHFLNLTSPQSSRLHYLDEGTGEPVIMVHGNPTWSYFFRHVILKLRHRYRCIVPDHVGMGLSDKPADSEYQYTLQSRINDLTELLNQLNITSKITLVVHDWGGMIGAGYAVQNPDRVSRLVILNTGAFPLPAAKPLPWQIELARFPVLGTFLLRGMNAFSAGAVKSCVTRKPLPADVAAAFCAPYHNWRTRLAVQRFIQDIPTHRTHPTFALVQQIADSLHVLQSQPMLICWGMRDFVFDHHFLEEWIARFPRAEVHKFPECGHYLLEDARDEVVDLIQSFLSRNPIQENQSSTT